MTTLLQRAPGAIFCEVDGDIVALNVERGECYGLDKVGAVVWSMLAEPTTIDAICEQLLTLYEVDPGECRTDVEQLLATLRQEGLVAPAS